MTQNMKEQQKSKLEKVRYENQKIKMEKKF